MTMLLGPELDGCMDAGSGTCKQGKFAGHSENKGTRVPVYGASFSSSELSVFQISVFSRSKTTPRNEWGIHVRILALAEGMISWLGTVACLQKK